MPIVARPTPDTGSSDPFDIKAAARQVAQSARNAVDIQKTAPDIAATIRQLLLQKTAASGEKTAPVGSSTPQNLSSSPVGNSGVPTSAAPVASGENAGGLPPDAMATMIQSLQNMSAADIAKLMEQIKANYANYAGDISTEATDWLSELLGDNFDPNDPNYAAMMADPTIAAYMGAMEQMGETGDQNLLTDLSWFLKQQQIYGQYLDSIPMIMAAQAVPEETDGGGGGGGRRYGGGGYGGGNEGNGPTEPFETQDTDLKLTNTTSSKAYQNYREYTPDAWEEAINGASGVQAMLAASGVNVPLEQVQGTLLDVWNSIPTENPANAIDELLNEKLPYLDTAINNGLAASENNEIWNAALGAPGDQVGNLDLSYIQPYLEATGQIIGDNPETDEVEYFLPNPELEGIVPTPNEQQQQLIDFFGPVANTYLSGNAYSRGEENILSDVEKLNSNIARRLIGAPIEEGSNPEIVAPEDGIFYNQEGYQVDENGDVINDTPFGEGWDINTPIVYQDEEGNDVTYNTGSWDENGNINYPPEELLNDDGSWSHIADIANSVTNPPTTGWLEANIDNPVIESLQGWWGNSTSLASWMENTYPRLTPEQRQLVDRVTAEVGLEVPESAIAAAEAHDIQEAEEDALTAEAHRIRQTIARPRQLNDNSYILDSMDSGKIEHALENAGRYSMTLDQLFGASPERDEVAPVADPISVINEDLTFGNGKLRSDFLRSMQSLSAQQADYSGLENPYSQLGQFFQDQVPTQAELDDLRTQQAAANYIRDVLNHFNPNLGMTLVSNALTDSASNTTTGTVTGTDRDQDIMNINELPQEDILAAVPTDVALGVSSAPEGLDDYDYEAGMGGGYGLRSVSRGLDLARMTRNALASAQAKKEQEIAPQVEAPTPVQVQAPTGNKTYQKLSTGKSYQTQNIRPPAPKVVTGLKTAALRNMGKFGFKGM